MTIPDSQNPAGGPGSGSSYASGQALAQGNGSARDVSSPAAVGTESEASTLSTVGASTPCNPGEPCTISNADFMRAIFRDVANGARPAVVSFFGNPRDVDRSAWSARPWGTGDVANEANNYFTISSYYNDAAGRFSRTKKTFAGLNCIMLDDIGTKVPRDRLTAPMSWLIETSEGNFQAGFILDEPITSAAEADRLMEAIIAAGLTDKGAGGPAARLARLPVAVNGKTTPPFPCRLVEWRPELQYSPDQLVAALGLELAPAGRPKASRTHRAPVGDDVLLPGPEQNPVLAALTARGLYKKPLGEGKHDITCPWVHEHTDSADTGTAYWEPDDGFPLGGFKCHHSHGERLRIRDLLKFLDVEPAAAKMKPTVRVYAGEIHRIVDSAEQLLAATGHYYQSAGLISVVRTDPASKEAAIIPLTAPALLRALSRAAMWEKFDGRAKDWVTCDPPARHCAVLYDAGAYPHLPTLLGIARQPHMRDDGTLVTASGYDPQTERFGVFNARAYRIPDNPSRVDAEAALKTLRGILAEVAFDEKVDEAAALSAMLTAAARPALPTAPGYHTEAHTISSGKSFLNRLISILATPENVAGIAFPGDADEMRKTLIALLVKSPAVINFDDLNGDIVPSEALKTALTEEFIGGRLLGVSKDVVCSTRSLFLFSGNNVGPVRDMTRRILPIKIDPRIESPVTRVFKRPNLAQLRQRPKM